MKLNEKHTVGACFVAIMVQALVINLPPLLFITFEQEFGISLVKISALIAISFITQLCMDLAASRLPRLFNKRITMVLGQVAAAAGLLCLALLPSVLPPYIALVIGTVIAAFGSGIIEVLGNPIVESCPAKNKNRILTLLHSFYCWGLVLTVLLSTLFFHLFGIESWRILVCLWACIPALNAVAFSRVPLYHIDSAPQSKSESRSIFRSFAFWGLFAIMLCAGAAEQAMSQWASSFAEMGLGVSKSMGDLLGPCAFAVLMGVARTVYAKRSGRMDLSKYMIFSAALCVAAYLIAALSPHPVISLLGCAICGFSVGIMWPGTICMASENISGGGVKMFAMLALAGDVGCTLGPTAAGFIAECFGDDLKVSFVASTVFPIAMIILIPIIAKKLKNGKKPCERI